MDKLYCRICKLEFSSGYAQAQHLRSREHKEKSHIGNVDSILDKFTRRFKELSNDESNKV